MVRGTPLDAPSRETAAAAAAAALDREVVGAIPIEEGLNAVYRIECVDPPDAVLKIATLVEDTELLVEAAVTAHVGAVRDVPVPPVLATAGPGEGPIDAACLLTAHREGRTVAGVLDVPPEDREGLVAAAGRHLGAIHGVDVADWFGRLGVADGELSPASRADSWAAWFDDLAEATIEGLAGEGFTTDDEARFRDLAAPIRAALTDHGRLGDPDPAFLLVDYRPANLVLAPPSGGDPLVRAVLDLGSGPTGDGLLDLALAEDALVDVPLGGTAAADRLRRRLRTAYADARGTEIDTGVLDGERYARYRLYARTRRLGAFGYWHRFAREDDPDAVAQRFRGFVDGRLAELV